MYSFNDFLSEGVNDPAIFKAVIFAGGPGSGKSTTLDYSGLLTLGFRVINSDPMFEKLLDDAGLDKSNPDDINSHKGQLIRAKAKLLTIKQKKWAIDGRLGMIIDGTGADYGKIRTLSTKLKRIGYEVKMVFVNTNLETAQRRNKQRPRSLDAGLVEKNWTEVQRNIPAYKKMFGNDFIEVENNKDDLNLLSINTTPAFAKIKAWSETVPRMPQAKTWIVAKNQQLAKNK